MSVLSICLNNSIDPASLTLTSKWFHKLGPYYHEKTLCVDSRKRTLACVCASMCVYVCEYVRWVRMCMHLCLYVCTRVRFFFLNQNYGFHSDILNNEVFILYKCICYPSRADFAKCYHYNSWYRRLESIAVRYY